MENKNTHQYEETVVVIKPEGVFFSKIGAIIGIIEDAGFHVCAMRMWWPARDHWGKHYQDISSLKDRLEDKYDPPEKGTKAYGNVLDYTTSNAVVSVLFGGANAVAGVRQLVLDEIRPKFKELSKNHTDIDVILTLVHASGTREEALKEKDLWFKPEEIFNEPADPYLLRLLGKLK